MSKKPQPHTRTFLTNWNDDSSDKIDGRTVWKYKKKLQKELTPEQIEEEKLNKLLYGKW